MQRTTRCIIKSTHRQFKVLDDITHKAKNLYNYANYQMRQHFFATGQIIDSGVGMTPSKRNALYHSHFEFEKVS